jgi:hypothetical protein
MLAVLLPMLLSALWRKMTNGECRMSNEPQAPVSGHSSFVTRHSSFQAGKEAPR